MGHQRQQRRGHSGCQDSLTNWTGRSARASLLVKTTCPLGHRHAAGAGWIDRTGERTSQYRTNPRTTIAQRGALGTLRLVIFVGGRSWLAGVRPVFRQGCVDPSGPPSGDAVANGRSGSKWRDRPTGNEGWSAMSSKALVRRLRRFAVVAATSSVVLASGAGMSAAYAAADNSTGNAGTSGTYNQPQPLSTADQNSGGANGGCSTDPTGIYCSTRDGSPSGNGNQDTGGHTGEPCAGCVGNADNKNPPGQETTDPSGTFPNNGYECDNNNGIGQTNPAHTGCQPGLSANCISAANGGGVTWTLLNGNSFAVTANWTSGSQSGSVTIPAATPVDKKTSTPGSVTFTTAGDTVK